MVGGNPAGESRRRSEGPGLPRVPRPTPTSWPGRGGRDSRGAPFPSAFPLRAALGASPTQALGAGSGRTRPWARGRPGLSLQVLAREVAPDLAGRARLEEGSDTESRGLAGRIGEAASGSQGDHPRTSGPTLVVEQARSRRKCPSRACEAVQSRAWRSAVASVEKCGCEICGQGRRAGSRRSALPRLVRLPRSRAGRSGGSCRASEHPGGLRVVPQRSPYAEDERDGINIVANAAGGLSGCGGLKRDVPRNAEEHGTAAQAHGSSGRMCRETPGSMGLNLRPSP